MRDPYFRGGSGSAPVPAESERLPTTCPTCKSSSIVTAAKSPNADSYWRCTGCGEMWNEGRRPVPQPASRGWR